MPSRNTANSSRPSSARVAVQDPSDLSSRAVSLIFTVRDEAHSLPALLLSLERQTRPPDEVVVVDAGSRDGTLDLLRCWAQQQAFPVHLLVEPGCSISRGRNAAIEAAQGPIIAVTDAGVTLEPDWLARLVAPFFGPDPPDAVAGLFQGCASGPFQTAMSATVLPFPEEARPGRFLPSSRSVAFTRAAWQGVGGYPEWASYSEDVLFDLALIAAGYRMRMAPTALVHFEPRRTLPAFWRQYRNYALGDGQTGLWPRRHAIRYATYLVLIPGLALASAVFGPWLLLGYLAGFAAYLRRPFRRLRRLTQGWPLRQRLEAAAWVPIIRVWGDIAKMVGYPLGWPRWRRLASLNAQYKAGKLRRAGETTDSRRKTASKS